MDLENAQYYVQSYFQNFNLKNSDMSYLKIENDLKDCIKKPFDSSDLVSIKEYINKIVKMNFIAKQI